MPDEEASIFGETHDGRQDGVAGLIRNDIGLIVLDISNFAVGRPKIDADDDINETSLPKMGSG
jgi:hypothetical protein